MKIGQQMSDEQKAKISATKRKAPIIPMFETEPAPTLVVCPSCGVGSNTIGGHICYGPIITVPFDHLGSLRRANRTYRDGMVTLDAQIFDAAIATTEPKEPE